jgi:hypothetical protein
LVFLGISYGSFSALFLTLILVSTGSAGIIQTIQRFSHGALVAGVLGIIATIGWAVQGLGNAFYYRQVNPSRHVIARLFTLTQIWTHHGAAGHTMEKVSCG